MPALNHFYRRGSYMPGTKCQQGRQNNIALALVDYQTSFPGLECIVGLLGAESQIKWGLYVQMTFGPATFQGAFLAGRSSISYAQHGYSNKFAAVFQRVKFPPALFPENLIGTLTECRILPFFVSTYN